MMIDTIPYTENICMWPVRHKKTGNLHTLTCDTGVLSSLWKEGVCVCVVRWVGYKGWWEA
jgi:hypothetical protein